MKKWFMVVGGVICAVVGIWLIVIFAPEVLLFLQGIVGILAGVVGAVVLFIGISEFRGQA